MSTNPVQAALKSLLPSTTAIPPQLQSAATSLLSVSRHRAANLKPDEEIARAHACAEIACKRLRAHLRLPNIKSGNGAPCRPTVYKRLVTFLEGVFSDVDLLGTPSKPKDGITGKRTPTTGGRSTGKKRVIEELNVEDDEDVDTVETPTKKQKTTGTTPLATPATLSAKKTNGFLGRIQASAGKGKAKSKQPEAPDYVLPTIRTLCKAFKNNKMVPHVYTGVVIGIDLTGLQPDLEDQTQTSKSLDEEAQDKLKTQHLCLMLAAFAVTLTRMHQGEITQETFDTVAERGLAIVGLNDKESNLKGEVEEWISKITDWAADVDSVTNWIDSIPLDALPAFELPTTSLARARKGNTKKSTTANGDVGTSGTVEPERPKTKRLSRREEIQTELEKEDPDDVLLPGLGTMVHDGIDYFSAEREAEYEEWKASMLRRIEAMEKSTGGRKGNTTAAVG